MVLFSDRINSVIFVINFGADAADNRGTVHYYYKEFKGLLKNIFVMDQFKANIDYKYKDDTSDDSLANKYFVQFQLDMKKEDV